MIYVLGPWAPLKKKDLVFFGDHGGLKIISDFLKNPENLKNNGLNCFFRWALAQRLLNVAVQHEL